MPPGSSETCDSADHDIDETATREQIGWLMSGLRSLANLNRLFSACLYNVVSLLLNYDATSGIPATRLGGLVNELPEQCC